MIITKDTVIADILKENPEAVQIFEKHNMGCVSCMGVQKETIEKGSLMHGIDVDIILAELQEVCK